MAPHLDTLSDRIVVFKLWLHEVQKLPVGAIIRKQGCIRGDARLLRNHGPVVGARVSNGTSPGVFPRVCVCNFRHRGRRGKRQAPVLGNHECACHRQIGDGGQLREIDHARGRVRILVFGILANAFGPSSTNWQSKVLRQVKMSAAFAAGGAARAAQKSGRLSVRAHCIQGPQVIVSHG
jgi:hypothetical protein